MLIQKYRSVMRYISRLMDLYVLALAANMERIQQHTISMSNLELEYTNWVQGS